MTSRSSHVRTKVVALLLSMTALWIFAAAVTLREGLNLLFVNTLTNSVGKPTESLLDALQQERRLSVVALSSNKLPRQALLAGRAHTDEVLASWRSHTGGGNLDTAATDQLKDRISRAGAQLDGLGEIRDRVDKSTADRASVVDSYSAIVDAGFRVYGSISTLDDEEIAQQARTLVALSRARELLSQEDALLAGALAAGTFNTRDIVAFTKLVGAQRFLYNSTSVELPPDDLALYEQATSSATVTRLRDLEDTIIARARVGETPPFTAATWQEAIEPAVKTMRDLELAATDHTVQRATPAAIGVMVRLALAGGLGLIAVIAAIIISLTTARSLIQQLEKLREAARDLADNRLPQVVARLSAGEKVDVALEAPPLSFGNDEIGQVGQAFNAVQETAVRAAVQQAELRRGVRDVFLSLARRTQNLVHKQLGLLDAIERRETDADAMDELFRIDHLATRMRRNAENLIVLSGATPGRTWRRPVAMIDVIRGALGEVEDYTRVNLLPVEPNALVGHAVGDLIHLLAELIENAVSYSPPYTTVTVVGQAVANGFVVEIEDRGLGMSEEVLATVNAQLADPPDFSLADTSRLGHYVVAKLAQRHGIAVHLRPSPYGGTVAIVLIPASLTVDDPGATDRPRPRQAAVAAAAAAGTAGKFAQVPHQRPDTVTVPDESGLPRRQANPVQPPAPLPAVTGLPAPQALGAAEDAALTPSGLPWRVRQASIVPQLKDDGGELFDEHDDDEPPPDPERVRQMMRSYQHGTQRGRTDATDETDAGHPEHSDHPSTRHAPRETLGDRQKG